MALDLPKIDPPPVDTAAVESLLEKGLDTARHGFTEVNVAQGLIIALVVTVIATRWKQIPSLIAVAVFMHVSANIMIPVVANNQPLRLPDFTQAPFWSYVLALFVGHALIISVFFGLKKALFRGAAAAHAH